MGLAPTTDDSEPAENGQITSSTLDEDSLAELAEHGVGIMLAMKLPPVTLAILDNDGVPTFNLGMYMK